MHRSGNRAGPSERIGAIILCCKRRLRLMIGGNPAYRIVASHASHDDVAFLHVRMTDIAVAVMFLRQMVHGHDTMMLRRDRVLTAGFTVVRRAKSTLRVLRGQA